MEFRADLHCHTNCSDGTDDPLVLLDKAKLAHLKGLSITDHDTIAAYTKELFQKAKELEITLLPGIEISSELRDQTVHILGYGIDLNALSLQSFLKEMQRRRKERNLSILKKLKNHNLVIEEEEFLSLAGSGTVLGRPHIASLMLEKGYVKTPQEAFDLYLKEGAPCYSPGFKYTPKEVIEEIHRASGKACLAHPHFFKKGAFLNELLNLSFDGMECYYGLLPKIKEAPWIEIAKKKGWIITGGSDYHGERRPHLFLGASYVSKETFDALY